MLLLLLLLLSSPDDDENRWITKMCCSFFTMSAHHPLLTIRAVAIIAVICDKPPRPPNSRNMWTKLLPLDTKDRYTAFLAIREAHLLDDGVYTCQVGTSEHLQSIKYWAPRFRQPFAIQEAYFNLIDSLSRKTAYLDRVTETTTAICSTKQQRNKIYTAY